MSSAPTFSASSACSCRRSIRTAPKRRATSRPRWNSIRGTRARWPRSAEPLAARNKQVASAAPPIVVRAERASANALTHKEQLDDAAAVIRKLAASTEDLDARLDLLRQADDLAKTAAVNRQIALYN